ncbi:MAG: ABC transporter permease [Clostridiales bacterium]|nr:ABC transporter permease [Clostridiales bacterium]
MLEFFTDPNIAKVLPTLPQEIWETLYSTVISTLAAYALGLPLGVLLVVGEKGGVLELPQPFMKALNVVINLLRSMPFLILMIMVLPLSMVILGTSVGTAASIPPLVIAAFPFVARVVESSLREVDKGVVEAAQSMGCSPWQIIVKVMLPESLPSLLSGATIALTTILGYGAMAGIIGGGGLGKVAINYGYYRYNYPVMIIAVILLIIIVQIFQTVGTHLSVRCDKRITVKSKRRTK